MINIKFKKATSCVVIFIITLSLLMTSGCQMEKPEIVVKKYGEYIKTGQYDKVFDLLSKESKGGTSKEEYVKEIKFNKEDEELNKAFAKLFTNIKFKPMETKIEGDIATVKTEVTLPDFSKIILSIFSEGLAIAFASDNPEEDMNKLLIDYINNEQIDTVKVTKNIKLVKEAGWKIDVSSFDLFENTEDLFNFEENQNSAESINIETETTSLLDENTNDTDAAEEQLTYNLMAEVTKVNVNSWKDSIDTIWTHGAIEITNTGDALAKIGNVQISVYDDKGSVVGVISSLYPVPDIISPGETAYAGESTIFDNLTDVNIKTNAKANIGYSLAEKPGQILEVRNIQGKEGNFGNYKVFGEIFNSSDKIADDIRICIALFDKDDNLIGVLSPYVDVALNPGDSMAFEGEYPNIPNEIGRLTKNFVGRAYNWSFDW